MKTDQVQGKSNLPVGNIDRPKSEIKNPENEQTNKEVSRAESSQKSKHDDENRELSANHLDAVKKLIGESIQWRQMRFYRHEEDGQIYVDIINKETGEVIRTVPEPELAKIATKFKHLAGMTLNING